MLQHYDVFSDAHIVNFSDPSLSSEDENRCILMKHVKENQKRMSHYFIDVNNDKTTGKEKCSASAIDQIDISKLSPGVGFPSMCAMFANISEFMKQGGGFFKNCDLRIRTVLQNRRKGSRSEQRGMCCISYAMLNNRVLDLEKIDFEVFGKMWKRFGMKEDTTEAITETTKELRESLQTQNKEFFLQHTAVYNSCLKNWFNKRLHLFLELCSVDIIKENLRGEKYSQVSGEPVFLMKDDKLCRHLAQRFDALLPAYPELDTHPLMQDDKFKSLVEEKRSTHGLVVYEDIENYE